MNFDILSHIAMLLDKTRMKAFEAAIRKTVRKGDVVVDIGAGTGILGFLALRRGARKVYAIEETGVINAAKKIAEKNGLSDMIEFRAANSRNTVLPEKADVLLMELVGEAAVNEDIVCCAADARKRLLKRNARIIPGRLSVMAAPVFNRRYARYGRLKNLSGIDFSLCMETAANRLMFFNAKPRKFILGSKKMFEFDLYAADAESLPSSASAVFRAQTGKCRVNGLAMWFEAELCKGVKIDSLKQDTHWAVVFLPLKSTFTLLAGDRLLVRLAFGRNVSCTWEAVHTRKSREINRSIGSTFLDSVLEADKIMRLNSGAVPMLDKTGYDTLLVLELAAKCRTQAEIARELKQSGRMDYPDIASADRFAKQVLLKYTV